METLLKMAIPEFYTAIAYTKGVRTAHDGIRRVRRTRYLCLNCKTEFEVDVPPVAGLSNRDWNDGLISCPVCSKRHIDYSGCESVGFCDYTNFLPENMLFTVKETKDAILLQIKAKAITLNANLAKEETRYEEFRFNVKTWVSTFKNWHFVHGKKEVITSYEIGNPFNCGIYHDSLLQFVANCNLSRNQKDLPRKVLKVIREAIRKKWKAFYGFDLGSIFVHAGTWYGKFLFPLSNIAFRLVCPDARNLSMLFSGSETDKRVDFDRNFIFSAHVFDNLNVFRNFSSSAKAMAYLLRLPATKMVLRYLHDDLFCGNRLGALLSMLGDQNYLPETIEELKKMQTYTPEYTNRNYKEPIGYILTNLERICAGHSGKEIIDYLKFLNREDCACRQLRDTANLVRELPAKQRDAAKRVKLKELHDWAIIQKIKIKKAGFSLEIPEYITRRLNMQLGLVKFFLPQHSRELQFGGEVFHNCVSTYAKRVKNGTCQIAFMTDNKGKLVACLEVHGDALTQAKLKFNRPVYQDGAINGAILEWCEKVGLKVKTPDVRKMRYPVVVEKEKVAV